LAVIIQALCLLPTDSKDLVFLMMVLIWPDSLVIWVACSVQIVIPCHPL